MKGEKRIPIKDDSLSIAESLRLADNYHKNRLIDPLEAYRFYNERMEILHGCNKGKTPFYDKTDAMFWGY